MNNDLIVPFAADLLLKSSAVLGFTWLTLQMWRRAAAAQRGCIWCVALALIAVLPFTRLVAPHWALTFSRGNPPVALTPTVGSSESGVMVANASMSVPPLQIWSMPEGVTLGVGVWLTGIFLLVAYRVAGAFLLHRCRRSSSPLQDKTMGNMAVSIEKDFGITRRVDIRVSGICRVPVTWGTWRPVVMFPAGTLHWPQEWLVSALRHEMGHVKNYDHLKRLVAFLTCAFYWPNPLVWVAAKQLQLAQEEASDNLVLKVGVSPQSYATQLVHLIQSASGQAILSMPAVAMARPSTLEGRLSAILDDSRNRGSADRRLMLVGTGLAVVLGLALGAIQLRAANTSTKEAVEPQTTEANSRAIPSAAQPGIALIEHKLNSIIIDKIRFDNANLSTVIQILAVKSKELDPDKVGICFVLNMADPASLINLSMENVPLSKVLDFVVNQSKIQYSIDDYAVYLKPPIDREMLTVRTFLVPPGVLKISPSANVITQSIDGVTRINVERQLVNLGFRFPVGASAILISDSGKIVVRNTPEQLDLIANFIEQLSASHTTTTRQQSRTPDAFSTKQSSPLKDHAIMAGPNDETGKATELKLKAITIPKVNFDKVDVAVALQTLTQKSREADPDKKGVQFVLGDITPKDLTGSPADHKWPIRRQFSVTLDNVPLIDLLGYITQQTNLKWSVEGDTVYFRP